MKTFVSTPDNLRQEWLLIDATDKILGRLATEIATRLKGKHKPCYTPNIDTGDYIVVINTDKIKVTGNKIKNKMYHRYTGYVGNLKSFTYEEMMAKDSTKILQLAVKGMLPRGPLGRAMLRKLNMFANCEHRHHAQQPKLLEI